MWHKNFADRLTSWSALRQQASVADLKSSLAMINDWWFQTPWIPYHLHWDDRPSWPDPWQLLDDNLFCSLARGLGILYTITLLERTDCNDVVLIDTGSDNLVLVDQSKYILNWDKEQIVNINLTPYKIKHSVSLTQIRSEIQ